MKKVIISIALLLSFSPIFSQASGNINYRKRLRINQALAGLNFRGHNELLVSVKGLYNLKADAFVAIFSMVEVAKNQKDVMKRMNSKIDSIEDACRRIGKKNEVFVDMISFVPLYELEAEKRKFYRKSYKEIPIGFELRKNIHVRFENANVLNNLVEIFAMHDIYDLVRVDYIIDDMEAMKKEMVAKAQSQLDEKIKLHTKLRGIDMNTAKKKNITQRFSVFYPVEKYSSYQAYANHSIRAKSGNIKHAEKNTTLYYMPLMNKDFDFVKNSIIHEPVVQLVYEIKFYADVTPPVKEKKEKKPEIKKEIVVEKQLYFLSPKGDIKRVDY